MKYEAPRQFAWFVPPNKQYPKGKFYRSGSPVRSTEKMAAAADHHSSHACYESVFQFPEWTGGRLTADIAKSAIIDRVFLDFDDKEYPRRAIKEAGIIAAEFNGHTTTNFSGMKGAHVMIHCKPANLIPDLKGSVLTRFAVELGERLGITTMDICVTGDLNRVHRIIDSKHPGSKRFAIGLTTDELLDMPFEWINELAKNTRRVIQRPVPSRWVTEELMSIEATIINERMQKLIDEGMLSSRSAYNMKCELWDPEQKVEVWDFIKRLEAEYRRIQTKKLETMPRTSGGRTPEETWLLKAVEIFRVVRRAANIQPAGSSASTSASEHAARVHLVNLANDCGWTTSEIVDIFSGADDYDRKITEGQVKSILRR